MPDIILVCVSHDLPMAEGLAEMFDVAGYSVGDQVFDDDALTSAVAGVLVLSKPALENERFRAATDRVLGAGKAVVASLEPVRRASLGDAPVFDLSGWYGEAKDPLLDPLFFAVERMRRGARMHAYAQPAPQEERVIAMH